MSTIFLTFLLIFFIYIIYLIILRLLFFALNDLVLMFLAKVS